MEAVKKMKLSDASDTAVEWRDVVGYEGLYKVSNNGLIKNVPRTYKMKDGRNRTIKEQYMKFMVDKDGYNRVGLRRNGKQRKFYVHRLVARAFIPNEEEKPQVNHIDGVKNNNFYQNLEWCTHKENRAHAAENGLVPDQWGTKNPNVKITKEDAMLIRKMRKENKKLKEIATTIGTSESNVKNVVYGYTWAWLDKKEADQT